MILESDYTTAYTVVSYLDNARRDKFALKA
jgi:hypothetical protein